MQLRTSIPKPGTICSALLMLLALLWLTVSTPFVYAAQQQAAATRKAIPEQQAKGDNNLQNITEEKTEQGSASLAEYLHHPEQILPVSTVLVKYDKCHSDEPYHAYHPDLLSPPPNKAGNSHA